MPSPVEQDRVSARHAAVACGLRYSEEFNRIRWMLEEAVDPATQERIPMPPELQRVQYLSGDKVHAMTEATRADYLRLKAERIAWCGAHWMRVPQWGGDRPPGTEWRYSLCACRAWRARMLAVPPAEGRSESEQGSPLAAAP